MHRPSWRATSKSASHSRTSGCSASGSRYGTTVLMSLPAMVSAAWRSR
ncbi:MULTISPECIES: MYXO-CTERM sorting domain-containing protein [Microbacterium]